jgi:hypothetical protein
MFLVSLMASCSKPKEVELIQGDPDERIADTLAFVRQNLVGAPNGWKAALATDLRGGYGLYMKFDGNDRVKMVADLNEKTATEVKESTYRIRQIMAATLSFDTYNYITMLQDPAPGIYDGAAGKGLGSDVEFDYIKARGDTLFFEGRKFKKTLYLVKANPDEEKLYLNKGLQVSINDVNSYFEQDVTIANMGDVKTEISIDPYAKLLNISGIVNDTVQSANIPYGYITGKNVYLIGNMQFNGEEFSSILYENEGYQLVSKNGKKYALSKSKEYILPPQYKLGFGIKTLQQPGPHDNSQLPMNTWSASYIADWNKYITLLAKGGYNLTLGDVLFMFDINKKVISASGFIYQGSSKFQFTYDIPYMVDMETGYMKFTDIKSTSGNGNIIVPYLNESIFKSMKDHDFKISYVKDDHFGQAIKFTRVDDPNYYFSWVR